MSFNNEPRIPGLNEKYAPDRAPEDPKVVAEMELIGCQLALKNADETIAALQRRLTVTKAALKAMVDAL